MNETSKTLAFVVAAVIAVGAAYLFDSTAASVDVHGLVGETLNADIDLAAPRRLEIVKFDPDTASVRRFEVAEVDGVWSIPSKENYPADATQQMAEAATCVMNRKILRIAGETAQQHEQFGVVDPLAAQLDSKSQGVGTRVIMTDADDDELVDMIIGKSVPDAVGQRFVRRSDQDVIYVVELDPKQLSTSFADWIEDDLLKLDVMDLRRVFVNDYSADLSVRMTAQGLAPQISLDLRDEFTLEHGAQSEPWELAQFKTFDPQHNGSDPRAGMVAAEIGEDEEVNQEAVDKLVAGLDDLLIVDVARKPDGLSADLKAGENFFNSQEAFSNLVEKGFIPLRREGGSDILSSEGEVICTQRNGVEYVLRFGQLQVQTESAEGAAGDQEGDATAAEAADATNADAVSEGGGENLRRYLFVMARFNGDAIEQPTYAELPEVPAEEPTAETSEGADDGETAAEGAAESSEGNQTDANQDEATEGDASPDQPADEASEPKAEAKPDREAILAERKAIEEQNQRLKEEYDALVAAGEEQVKDLNERFGDWYFVISDNVYKQIHLGRDGLIKKKTPPAEDDAAAPAEDAGALSGLPTLPGVEAPAESAEESAAEPAPSEEQPADDAPAAEGTDTAAVDEAPAEPSEDAAADATQPEVPPAPAAEDAAEEAAGE